MILDSVMEPDPTESSCVNGTGLQPLRALQKKKKKNLEHTLTEVPNRLHGVENPSHERRPQRSIF